MKEDAEFPFKDHSGCEPFHQTALARDAKLFWELGVDAGNGPQDQIAQNRASCSSAEDSKGPGVGLTARWRPK